MSQHAERARALKQARKLMEMTTAAGASENEAQMAMERLSKLKQTFNLTLDEIVVSDMQYVTGEVEQTAVKGCVLSGVITAIGRFTDTKVWQEAGKMTYVQYRDRYGQSKYRRARVGNGTYKFFGIDSDVEMAKFLYEMIASTLTSGEAKYMKSPEYRSIGIRGGKRAALVSFRKGYARRIRSRLFDLAMENEAVSEAAPTGSDIVIVKEKVREEKFQEQLGIKLVKSKSYKRGVTHMGGATAGATTANNVNFSRPVGSGSSSQLLLT